MVELIIAVTLMVVGYIFGTIAERRHFRSLDEREAKLLPIPVVNIKNCFDPSQVKTSELVSGAVVISADYFKVIVASLKNLVGGRLTSYESLMDRARREAILRMKEQSPGADMFINVRLETSSINGEGGAKRGGIVSVEAIAYGTAITLLK